MNRIGGIVLIGGVVVVVVLLMMRGGTNDFGARIDGVEAASAAFGSASASASASNSRSSATSSSAAPSASQAPTAATGHPGAESSEVEGRQGAQGAPDEGSEDASPGVDGSGAGVAAQLECIAIDNPLYLENLPATHAVHVEFDGPAPDVSPVPESQKWDEGWILASPAGGLWLGYSRPTGSDASGLTLAINEAALEESVFGMLSRSSYGAALRGLTGASPAEAAAQACAARGD